jgi:hypothetical protein
VALHQREVRPWGFLKLAIRCALIKNQIFKFVKTARRQPEIRNPFGCGGQKKQGFCCAGYPLPVD